MSGDNMSRFLTTLDVVLVDDTQADGQGMWKLDQPLAYQSALVGKIITVPAGFQTDFASVPRLPVAYWLFGDTSHPAAVIHDYLYSTGEHPRSIADAVLLEAMETTRIPAWRRYAMYLAVRAFGGGHFANGRAATQPPLA